VTQEVTFGASEVAFAGYRYPGAAVFPSGRVAYAAIRDVDPNAAPPEPRLRTGEILFVSATQRDELVQAAATHRLRIVRRFDVWSLLLEPFLDTEFAADDKERTLALLAENGVPREEALALRRRFARRMLAYNAIHWDWAHLGLSDLLDASLPRLPLPFLRARFERLYWEAMAIAERGRPIPA
jgi:hypothetical protein